MKIARGKSDRIYRLGDLSEGAVFEFVKQERGLHMKCPQPDSCAGNYCAAVDLETGDFYKYFSLDSEVYLYGGAILDPGQRTNDVDL